jgi:Gamma-glutamyl cyclotransferase, AIG2-like
VVLDVVEVAAGDLATRYPEFPYPGRRPAGTWWLDATGLSAVHPREDTWWDATGRQYELAGRELVLGYGSNGNPSKLLRALDLTEGVLALRAVVRDHAAVWCDARRSSGDVVCTLAPAPGSVETHLVLAVTPRQLAELDRWEGHPRHYRRERFDGRVDLNGLPEPGGIWVYLGTPEWRPVLLREGRPQLVAEVDQDTVDAWVAP